MTVTVKWAKEIITFQLPPPDTPLAAIRSLLADATHLPQHAFKLIHAGAIMKDDSAPISAYKLKPNSTITLIGSSDPPIPPGRHHYSPPNSEQSLVATIQAEAATVRTDVLPSLQSFLLGPTHNERLRLSELLLQSLLRLDAILPDSSWELARSVRKDAVKEVQAMLDRLDDAWANRPTS